MLRLSIRAKVPARGTGALHRTPLQQFRAQSTDADREQYWKKISLWKDIPTEQFASYRWQTFNTIYNNIGLHKFLVDTLPATLGPSSNPLLQHLKTKDEFIQDTIIALQLAPMSIRLSPQLLSRVDWENPLDDPIRKQFIPLKSGLLPDHENLTMDSLHEEADSPIPGLVRRYPGRALFLATSICPVYCRFCTRSYAVGVDTQTVQKAHQKPSKKRWELIFRHIENDPTLQDIVVSGGDVYYLNPEELRIIGDRLLSIPHLLRIRFASKGLAVAPGRILEEDDPWRNIFLDIAKRGRQLGKQVCLHTHFNHAKEITWITRKAAEYLFRQGVIVRNQSVLLRGVNDSVEAISDLIKSLSDVNIQPYYIYQCDMVRGIEDLRTPLSKIINLDKEIRGTLSGFMMPSFVVDLPGGGGKRLVSTAESYNEATGVAVFKAPGLSPEKRDQEYTYCDPAPFPETEQAIKEVHQHQDIAYAEILRKEAIKKAAAEKKAQEQEALKKAALEKEILDKGAFQNEALKIPASKEQSGHEQASPRPRTQFPRRPPPNQFPIYNADHHPDNTVSARGFHNQSTPQ